MRHGDRPAIEVVANCAVGFDNVELEALRVLPNVVATPHIGSATRETRGRMVRTARRNLLAVLRGEEPPDPVERPEKAR